jgi:glycosyltransferase involved in cell wall biosynthesis
MTFDIIITTYNRPEKVELFVKRLCQCSLQAEKIIVVDSSDTEHISIQSIANVKYIRSQHKNQPFQRYLGASQASSEILCFFDDDLEVTDNRLFEYLLESYQDKTIAGSSVGIDYHNSIQYQTPQSLMETSGSAGSFFLKLSGVKFPAPGRISYAGMTGPKPSAKQEVDFFYGPCMSFRREQFMSTLYPELLTQFELKRGMGEDKVISMLMSAKGKLVYNPTICLHHPAVESSYFSNTTEFVAKTIYSRKLLNIVYANIHHKNSLLATFHLWWYLSGRLIISLITFLIKRDHPRKQKLNGILKGISMILSPVPLNDYHWQQELKIQHTI